MNKLMNEKVPPNPCTHCVPPKRNAECHAKCEAYLKWEAIKNKIVQARWEYRDSVTYTSNLMMQVIKRNQMGK